MDDEVYTRRLLGILTNPHPTGIRPEDPYGQADDGIDRYSGFGRDVWVESLEVAEGEHGAELEIEFGLAVPPDSELQGLPPRGSLRVPFDAEWRELSGYEDPVAYAPAVAREVESAFAEHVRHHRSDSWGGGGARPALPSREAQWQILVDALSCEGTVREVAPGRIELRDSDGDVVTVVVSPDQWERVLADHAWGDVDMFFADLLGPRQGDETFVVFYKGDLFRSTREKLPPVRGRELERQVANVLAENPGAQLSWHAYSPQRGEELPPT